MAQKLIICGSGDLAREMAAWVKTDKNFKDKLHAFVDPYSSLEHVMGIPILKNFDEIGPFKFFLGISKPDWRKEFIERAIKAGGAPSNYSHSTCTIAADVKFGVGVFIAPNSSISTNVNIEDYVHVNVGVGIGHDVKIGQNSVLLGGNLINGNVEVGPNCVLGSGCIIYPGKKVRSGSTVGIGSVVIKNVRENETVFGNPAKSVKL